jgi:2-amino-4-hydroxy-6-hydroxymethyldihydropteridine diphosphokinase
MHKAYIGLGANLDDPVAQVRAAFAALDAIDSTRVEDRSSLYRSQPVGYAEQPDFVNAVARIASGLDARTLLARLAAIEQSQGRVRAHPNGPRTLDLDLLLFDDDRITTDELVVPHPRMHERAFVLIPLTEIAPGIVIPGRGPAARLLERIGCDGVERLST